MVNEFKLTVVHVAHQNPMQICACAWIYRRTKNGGNQDFGPLGGGPAFSKTEKFGLCGFYIFSAKHFKR